MPPEVKREIQLEIAHVLFIDIVGYSKLSINEQHAAVEELNQVACPMFHFARPEAPSAHTLGDHDGSIACARGNRRWDRNVFSLPRAIDADCAGKKRCGASFRKPER